MAPNVISTIVKNDLCIGCGLCAAMCPEHKLIIQFNRFEEYNPVQDNDCNKDCGLCLTVCPFADGNDNEDSIGNSLYSGVPGICHRFETGYYLDCFVGYAPETRNRGSSGGMATWFLSTLMKKGIVDHVIAVVSNDDPDQLYKFSTLHGPESILASAGSAYYPVELSGVLQELQNKPGKYAIIGLPCFIKAIRLAMQRNRKLRDKIVFTVGIVCGQLKSKHYTNYISALSGVCAPLQKVYYRGKSCEKPANLFYFSCMNKKGDIGKIFWDEGVAEAWCNHWFTPIACNYCDDVFAECADVAFMDAWLPEYSGNYLGTSLVLVRSAAVQNIIIKGIESEEIHLDKIPVQKVIDSQKSGITEKRANLAYRLHLAHSRGFASPKKRVDAVKTLNPFLKWDIELKEKMQRASRESFNAMVGHNAHEIRQFRRSMNRYLQKIDMLQKISAVILLPIRGFQYLKNLV
jgi:coenzyme F420 hydrogenase subunit beta